MNTEDGSGGSLISFGVALPVIGLLLLDPGVLQQMSFGAMLGGEMRELGLPYWSTLLTSAGLISAGALAKAG